MRAPRRADRGGGVAIPVGHPSVASVIPGGLSPEHVRQNVAAFRHRIPPALWAELKHEGLLRADAPTP
jgi:D-threo-aldose 1-dehydrogenase